MTTINKITLFNPINKNEIIDITFNDKKVISSSQVLKDMFDNIGEIYLTVPKDYISIIKNYIKFIQDEDYVLNVDLILILDFLYNDEYTKKIIKLLNKK